MYDFSVIHSNLNGAKSHLDEFFDTISQNGQHYSVIGASETRLRKEEERFFSLSRYTSLFNSRATRNPGGGVGLFIHEDISARGRLDLGVRTIDGAVCESVFGECSGVVVGKSIIVGVIYRQPGGTITAFLDSLEETLNLIAMEGKSALIMGEFNIDTLVDSLGSRQLSNLMACYNFSNVISSPTCEGKGLQGLSSTCIDHVWINFGIGSNPRSGVLRTHFSDHYCPFLVVPTEDLVINAKISYRVRYDLDQIFDEIKAVDWDPLYRLNSPDQAYDYFHETLWSSVNANMATVKRKSNYKKAVNDWVTPAFLRLLQNRDIARRSYLDNPGDTLLRDTFISLRNRATCERRRLKIEFNENRVRTGLRRGKSPWEVVNVVLGAKVSKACGRLQSNGLIIDDRLAIAELFNEYYTSCVSLDKELERSYVIPPLFPTCPQSCSFTPVIPERVQFIIEHLKTTSVSLGQVPVCVLKKLALLIAAPLSYVINLTIASATFPQSLKEYRVIPLYKGGDSLSTANYRPISISAPIAKAFERVILDQIQDHVNRFNIIADIQYGFRECGSTTVPIWKMVNDLRGAKDKGYHSVACLVDVKKAFDSVSPHILSVKLRSYGFDQNACNLIYSFMTNRSQFVDVGGNYSARRVVDCGVPQGSLLGPTLFSLFFNDLCSLPFFANECLYADDTTLYISGLDLKVVSQKLSSDLYLLDHWMSKNCLAINASKSEVLHIRPKRGSPGLSENMITINNQSIPCSAAIRFLGVLIDDDLSGSAYFAGLKRKLIGGVAALCRARRHLNEKSLLLIYHAFFSSHLSYGVEAFGLTYSRDVEQIYKLQKRALRIVTHKGVRDHTAPIFVRLDILPYPLLVRFSVCVFIFKLLTDRIPKILSLRLSSCHTRGSNSRLIMLNRCSSNVGQFSIGNKGASIWNDLPADIRVLQCSVNTFKCRLKKYLFGGFD